MRTYADAHRCPDCDAAWESFPGVCPSCGLTLTGPTAAELFTTLQRADQLLATMRRPADTVAATGADTVAAAPLAPAAGTEPLPVAPAPVAPRPRGLSGASVPRILLTLGALCLLVAAVTFLVVAWSWLGVGGRTAVLIGFTALAFGLAWWLWRRNLRAAAEALSIVGFGMLALDVVGAEDAGWFGHLSSGGLVATVGVVLGVCGVAVTFLLGRRGRALWAPQVVSGVGWWLVPGGLADLTVHDALVFFLGSAALGALAYACHRAAVGRLDLILLPPALFWWLSLAGIAVNRLASHPTLSGLWAQGHAWPALAAAGLLAVAALAVRRWPVPAGGLLGIAAALVTLTAVFPALDSTSDRAAAATLGATAVWALGMLALRRPWKLAAVLPMLGSAVAPAALGLETGGRVVDSLTLARPWTLPAGARLAETHAELHPAYLLLTGAVAGLAVVALSSLRGDAVAFARRFAPFLLAGVLLAGVLTVAAYDVPRWLVLAALVLVAALLAGWAARRTDVDGRAAATLSALVLGGAVVVSLPSVVLTLLALAAVLLVAGNAALLAADDTTSAGAYALLPPVSAGLVWTIAELGGLDDAWRAVPALLVVGLMALLRPRLPVELPAAASALVASAASVAAGFEHSDSWGRTSAALCLTVAGAFVTASALAHPHRRLLAYPGGLLLAAATWVRLYDLGVHAPEAYTLPSALVLVALGLRRLSRDAESSTLAALGPGLTLATVPTLLRLLGDDAVSLRPLLLGIACLTLVLGGTRLRWTAPLVVGAVVGALLVIRELGPYAADLPPWLLIALAGTALTLVGVTWESRLQDLRQAGRYLTRLR